MTNEELMQAVLLALTRQNVTGEGSDSTPLGFVEDFDGVWTLGWIVNYPAIYGEYGE